MDAYKTSHPLRATEALVIGNRFIVKTRARQAGLQGNNDKPRELPYQNFFRARLVVSGGAVNSLNLVARPK